MQPLSLDAAAASSHVSQPFIRDITKRPAPSAENTNSPRPLVRDSLSAVAQPRTHSRLRMATNVAAGGGAFVASLAATKRFAADPDGTTIASVHAGAVLLGLASACWIFDSVIHRSQTKSAPAQASIRGIEIAYWAAFFASVGMSEGLKRTGHGQEEARQLIDACSPSVSTFIFMVQAARGIRMGQQAAAARSEQPTAPRKRTSVLGLHSVVALGIAVPLLDMAMRYEKVASGRGDFLWSTWLSDSDASNHASKWIHLGAESASATLSLCLMGPLFLQLARGSGRARAGHAHVTLTEGLMAGLGTGIGVVSSVPHLVRTYRAA